MTGTGFAPRRALYRNLSRYCLAWVFARQSRLCFHRILMAKSPYSDLELPATSGTTFKFSAQRGHPFVMYFYPKDNTPGCTTEGQHFRDFYTQFEKAKCAVFGLSRDSLKSHENFKAKMRFPFELLSDEEETACK